MLVVVDASAWIEVLLGTEIGVEICNRIEDESNDLHAPGLCDIEVVAGLRRCLRGDEMDEGRAHLALVDYLDLPITRHDHTALLERIFELHENFSPYDATYVALAESLGAAVVSADERLNRAIEAHLPDLLSG